MKAKQWEDFNNYIAT